MASNIAEMKADTEMVRDRLGAFHTESMTNLTAIKIAVNDRSHFMEGLLKLIVIALIILAGAGQALKYLGLP